MEKDRIHSGESESTACRGGASRLEGGFTGEKLLEKKRRGGREKVDTKTDRHGQYKPLGGLGGISGIKREQTCQK